MDALLEAFESLTGGSVDYMAIIEAILSIIKSLVAKFSAA